MSSTNRILVAFNDLLDEKQCFYTLSKTKGSRRQSWLPKDVDRDFNQSCSYMIPTGSAHPLSKTNICSCAEKNPARLRTRIKILLARISILRADF
ncbi:hypothetical protein ATANTOWER_008361 [Ataeniobius toweri]|uniref:Uncharacterized protein n=1 Tax=Ataeniobius toweri TaxID=208326 RepID=A0ABU7AWP2_9TELE|nr:hypothetical protein [Ataeniobius toweri]